MLIKNSPLSGIYRRHSVNTVEVSGWLMADDFGNPEKEQKHLQEQCVIADWSHLGKISLSGAKASSDAEKMIKGASKIKVLNTLSDQTSVAFRLTQNDYLLLTGSGNEESLLDKVEKTSEHPDQSNRGDGVFCPGGPEKR